MEDKKDDVNESVEEDIKEEGEKEDLTEEEKDATVDIHMGNKSLWDQALDANEKLQQEQSAAPSEVSDDVTVELNK